MIKNTLFSIACALFLSACGGGDSPQAGTSDTLVGVFSDSPVSGLTYKTATQTGITNTKGEFNYLAGETIIFSVGNVILGESIVTSSLITPLNIVPNAQVYKSLNALSNFKSATERQAFLVSSNILIFLQSLDADRNPDNGITLSDGITTLFENSELDFNQPFSDFSSTLKPFTDKAHSAGAIISSAVVKPHVALEHFYQAQNITHQFSQLDSLQVDTDGDGSIDTIITYGYDARGNEISKIWDNNADGSPDSISTSTYNERGNRLSTISDWDMNGTPDAFVTISYDENGYMQRYTQDDDALDGPDFIDTYHYDKNGNLLSEINDENADGSPDRVSTYTYDGSNNNLTEVVDTDGDENPNWILTNNYDHNSRVISQSMDNDGDGIIDEISNSSYIYNERRQVLEKTSYNQDGHVTSIYTITYDVKGNILTTTYATGPNVQQNVIHSFSYDDNGNKLSFTKDLEGDGTPERVDIFTYDENGNLLTEVFDYDGDSIPDAINSYSYSKGPWPALWQ